MKIRTAAATDLPELLHIYDNARAFMVQNGNPTQWANSGPCLALLQADIQRGELFVAEDAGHIEAVFLFTTAPDPTYAVIYDGEWPNDRPYGTIHRLASAGRVPAIAQICLDWCYARCGNLRGDTHRDNRPMQHGFRKNGMKECGIIYVEDGTARLAFQKE
ncbi:MAG: GNAT family N-acetyltransferase [Oscillospiraceae bacterium]|nr:GNAT family N-acetyltransferase [Oscillospiraceae bacterium]